jgi:broad specificity phosphatase PhoE
MKIYFVRHGESVHNSQRIHQPLDIPLSNKGEKQAELVAKRFQSIDIDLIISSDLTRAQQTAEAIQQSTGKELVITELGRERFQPSIFHHKSIDDPSLTAIKTTIEENINDPNYHYADEENFFDLKARSKKFLEFLEARPEKSMVVVTHGTILRYLLMTMAYGENYNWSAFIGFAKFVHLNNTGITLCEKRDGQWKLMTWNDQLHLGEVS